MKHENTREHRWKLKKIREENAWRADLMRYCTPERMKKNARKFKSLRARSTPGSAGRKAVTEERLAGVLAARRRRERGQSPGGALGGRLAEGTRPEAVALYQNSRAGRG